LQRVRTAWDDCQASRDRNAIYGYLTAVYGLVAWWSAEGREVDRTRRALRLQRLDTFVALAGNGLTSSPKHSTGVKAAARAVVSTRARTTVVQIIAIPQTVASLSLPIGGGIRKATKVSSMEAPGIV
jgi:hypothetical protein